MIVHVKKNLLFVTYILFNIILATFLLTIDYGYLIVALFVAGGHIRDVFSVVYQVFHIQKVLRRCPDSADDGANNSSTICCLVPVYNEEPLMLKKNIHALTTQRVSANTKVLIVLIFDGLGEHNIALFDSVVDLVDDSGFAFGKELWYQNWKSKEDNKLVYNVGRYNDTTIVLSYKDSNSGKKDSLIIGEKFITSGIPEIESIGVARVDFIYHTDGDTVSDENCLDEMLRSLKDDPNLDGVSGLLRTYAREDVSCTERGFVAMQDFQYFFSLMVRRMTESLLNSTTCLPGCSNMIRIGSRTDVAIEKYGNLPANESSLVQTVTRMQGTDRRYTTLLLKQGSNLQMNWRAFVHTEPPLNATSFINQRRRWSSNSFFNSIVLLYSSNIPMYIRASTLFDIGRVFSTLFRFVSYFCFWIFIKEFSSANLLFLSLFIILPYVYAFVWVFCIIPEWKQMIAGFFLNKMFMPFLSVVAVTKMFFTSTNFAWGSTSEVSTSAMETSQQSPSPPEPVSSPPDPAIPLEAPRDTKKPCLEDCATMSLSPHTPPACSPCHEPHKDKRMWEGFYVSGFFCENPKVSHACTQRSLKSSEL